VQVKLRRTNDMENGSTSDFVVDLLSMSTRDRDRSGLPPKPAPRRRNRRPQQDQQVPATGGGSVTRQALPPDDNALSLSAHHVPVANLTENAQNDVFESHGTLESQVHFTLGDVNDFQSCEYKRETSVKPYVMSSSTDDFDRLLHVSSSASCNEELLLASVPYHTLRIEPSPALTLDAPKHRSSRTNAEGSVTGRLKSSGSFCDDLDNLQDISSFGEPTRSSSTPLLTGDGNV